MGGHSSDSLEVEVTVDVDDDTPLPDWSLVAPVAVVSDPELRELDALYFDTAEVDLGRAQYALRRRTGGPDEGWHLKGPPAGHARRETHWPLTGSDEVPAATLDAIADLVDAPLVPIARIRNTRTAYALLDAAGKALAEMVDDRVRALDLRTGTQRQWREWEIELGAAAPADADRFFSDILAAAAAVGARPASTDSKLARALGL